MAGRTTRRQFLQSTALTIGGSHLALAAPKRILGANERLNVGVIGVGGRGASDLAAMTSENVVAICDVDENRLNAAGSKFPKAQKFFDYRQLIERQDLDAVVIATPDHHHAPATMRALKRSLHVYCEKPLTHTVQEARLIAKTAAKMKVATQMGTQNHQHPGYLKTVELIKSGAIGTVREVHVITDRPGRWWPQGLNRPQNRPQVPANLKWDLWLGPAAARDYHPAYVPFKWRGWWDFGCGAIGDMAIHLMDPTFWALDLGCVVEVTAKGPKLRAESAPEWMIVDFAFAKRGNRAPCKVVWYEGTAKPKADIAAELPMNGSLFIGDKGRLAVKHGGQPTLLPKEKFADFKAPEPFLPTSPGHHKQWIEACKTGKPTGSHFGYAAPFTEIVLLGNVAFRAGQTIRYDQEKMKITNLESANSLLTKDYRKGCDL